MTTHDDLEIRTPVPSDTAVLEDMITDHFSSGSDYTVELGIDDPSSHVLVAELEGLVVGVMALTCYEKAAEVGDAMHMFESAEAIPEGEKYGFLHMGYVREGFTGQGIGSTLFEEILAIGADEGVDLFVSDSWFHGGDDSPANLFDRYEFGVVRRRDISGHADDGVCPKCGADCVCDAALVVRDEE